MGLVVMGSLVGFMTAVGGFALGLSPGTALGIWAGSGPVAALVAIIASRPDQLDEDYTEPPGALPVFA